MGLLFPSRKGWCQGKLVLWRGPSLGSLAAGKGVPVAAPDGDLGSVPLQSWSWGPPQDPKGCLCSSHFPTVPPPGLQHSWIKKKVVWVCAHLKGLVLAGTLEGS